MKDHTRVDIFANVDELIKFYEWAEQFHPKNKADMVRLLGEYKAPDMMVADFKERVEARIINHFQNKAKEVKKNV